MDKKAVSKHTPAVNHAICKGCEYCVESCSRDVFELSSELNSQGYRFITVARGDNCTGCMKCFAICPDFAISISETASE